MFRWSSKEEWHVSICQRQYFEEVMQKDEERTPEVGGSSKRRWTEKTYISVDRKACTLFFFHYPRSLILDMPHCGLLQLMLSLIGVLVILVQGIGKS